MAYATISVTIEGATYSASYELKRGIVTVRTDIGTMSVPLSHPPPDVVARTLLRELIQLERLRREGIL